MAALRAGYRRFLREDLRLHGGAHVRRFVKNDMVRAAVDWHLLVIGEAAKHVPSQIRERYSAIEWRKIAGLRDVLAHGYFGLDDETLWDAVTNKVPELLRSAQELLLDAP